MTDNNIGGGHGLLGAVNHVISERVESQARGCNMLRKFILTPDIATPSVYKAITQANTRRNRRSEPFTVVTMKGLDNVTNKDFILNKNELYRSGKLHNENKSVSDSYIHEFIYYQKTDCNRFRNRTTVKLDAGSLYHHTHVLARITEGEFELCETTDDAQGAIIPCLIVPLYGSGFSAVYYRIDNTHNMRISKADCYVVACAYAGKHRLDPFLPVSHRDLYSDKKVKVLNSTTWSRTQIINMINQAAIPTFASNYHQNIEAEDIEEVLRDEHIKVLNDLPLGRLSSLGKPALIGIILWYLSLNEVGRNIVATNRLFDCDSPDAFIQKGKKLSETAKFLQNVCGVDLIQLFEVHTLINRIETPIDWQQERENRVNPKLAKVSPDFVFRSMVEVFKNKIFAHGCKYKTMEWDTFWNTRFEWSSSGADFSQYAEDNIYRDSNQCFRNKMMLLNAMPGNIPITKFLQRKPQCVAKTSIKYEWSKQRAIYGCDLTNFLMFQFALGPCEEYLDNRFASGVQSNVDIVNAHIKSILQNSRPLCLDFEDFNSQHSNDNMCAVLRAFYHVFNSKMTEDQKLAFGWCLESMKDQIVIDNIGLKTTYNSAGTLFSGWRLTSFINSALNYCYFQAVNAGIRHDAHAHSGDDIIAGITMHSSYRDIIKNCLIKDVRLSQGKCHYASVSEFLRVDHESSMTGQYLARSIATLTFSRIETDPAYDIKDICESYLTRSAACVARGGDRNILSQLTTAVLNRKNKIVTGSRVPLDVLVKQSRVCGGLSDLRVCEYSYDIEKLSFWKLQRLGIIEQTDLPEHPMYGVDDYARELAKRFRDYEISVGAISKKLTETLVTTFARIPSRYIINKLEDIDINRKKVLRAIKGAHTKSIRSVDYGRARTVGVLLDLIENCTQTKSLAAVVRNQPDKLKILSIIV